MMAYLFMMVPTKRKSKDIGSIHIRQLGRMRALVS